MKRENILCREAPIAADQTALPDSPRADHPSRLESTIQAACGRVAPLWPLKHFVAVNPFLGLADRRFADACGLVRRVVHGNMLMPIEFYRQQFETGRITDADLQRALEGSSALPMPFPTIHSLKAALFQRNATDDSNQRTSLVLTVADLLDQETGSAWAGFLVEEISKWCAAYFDEGQSAWRMPWRGMALYAAWKQAASFDRNPELMGLKRFRRTVAELPDDPRTVIANVLGDLAIPEHAVEEFLHRQLMSIAGWSAHVQYRVRENSLHGQADDALVQLLAIRLAYDHALHQALGGPEFDIAWTQVFASKVDSAEERRLRVRVLLHEAYETATQRDLIARLAANETKPLAGSRAQAAPAVQAVFCIDVRSEVYRRALETAAPEVETLGFAGFFGFPIEYIPFGHRHGTAQCPALLSPKFRIRETVTEAPLSELEGILAKRVLKKRVAKLWKSFKTSAVSCFSYVEAAGLLFGPKLVTDSFGLTRTVARPGTEGLDRAVVRRMGPLIHRQRGRLAAGGPVEETGIALSERVELARNALRGMGLTGHFARLVLLCGHGSTTVNNPYGSGLDCGACGGHTGEVNARVAAAILNDRDVRAGLAVQGIAIPGRTLFVAALHDTTTDEVRLFDAERLPRSHDRDIARLRLGLHRASERARGERSGSLGIAVDPPAALARAMKSRSRDWSQVRPEWGLAGNAAFVAAPRERTRGLNLGGRVFLHNYDPAADADGSILELIMTAPMVVASWINLQYYASTVDNRRFGSGNKVLHNVVGTLGVLQGNGGDLRTGLPWQSVHDGRKCVHEPVRLSVFIEAGTEALERVIAKHESVRQLVENGWVHLFRLGEQGQGCYRYTGRGQWREEA